jgi:hypothetical protein
MTCVYLWPTDAASDRGQNQKRPTEIPQALSDGTGATFAMPPRSRQMTTHLDESRRSYR